MAKSKALVSGARGRGGGREGNERIPTLPSGRWPWCARARRGKEMRLEVGKREGGGGEMENCCCCWLRALRGEVKVNQNIGVVLEI
jgi:hypothetical protein